MGRDDQINAVLRARVAEALADPRPTVPLADGMAAVRAATRE